MIKDREPIGRPTTYTLHGGFTIEYDPKRALIPDKVSEVVGAEAAQVVNTLRFIAQDPRKEVRILELGVGTGVGLVSTLLRVKEKQNVVVHGIDIDPYCVETTQHNLDRLANTTGEKVASNLWQADWLDPKTWEELEKYKYHVILFNPPYLPFGEDAGAAYANVPPSMMFTDDAEGLQHYRHVMPLLPSVLSDEEGSTLLIRKSSRFAFDTNFEDLRVNLMNSLGGSSYVGSLYPVEPDRLAHIVSITRNHEGFAPHKDPQVLIAMQQGLDRPLEL